VTNSRTPVLAPILYAVALEMAADAKALMRSSADEQRAALASREQSLLHWERVLRACAGNRSLAAEILGIDRNTITRKLKRLRAKRGGRRRQTETRRRDHA
jgi:DNA-binding NtrC family response regulator